MPGSHAWHCLWEGGGENGEAEGASVLSVREYCLSVFLR